MGSYRDKIFVDQMERLFLMNTFPLEDFPPKKIEEPTELDIDPEPTIQTVHGPLPRSKQQRSTVDVPFVIIREPHHDFQAFGDTDGSLSRIEIQPAKGSSGLITDGKFTTPGLRLVVDKLQILDDNLRQIEEVVEEHGDLIELMQQRPPETVENKSTFLASETGDGYFSQETVQYNVIEVRNQIKLSKSEKLAEVADSCKQDLEIENGIYNPSNYQQLETGGVEDITSSIDIPINDEENEKQKCEILQLDEELEELDTKYVPETPSELSICKAIMDETDVMDSELKHSKCIWRSPFNFLANVETTTDAVQNVLGAAVCVLVVMCFIDNLSA